jgi:chromosome segregation ATPase
MNKIYPQVVGNNKEDKIDVIVDDVQRQIDKIVAETNNFVADFHSDADDHVTLTRSLQGKNIPASSSLSAMNNRSRTKDQLREISSTSFKKRLVSSSAVQPFSHADSMEEIKLSHELVNDEKEIASELADRFAILQSQLEEYYKLYKDTNEKLKGVEKSYNDIESKYHHLEEEKIVLEEEIKKKQMSTINYGSSSSAIGGGNKGNEKYDLQKRSDELRKLLLFENDDEDIAISLDDLFKGKNLLNILSEFINYFIPLKRDISTIQSRYGTSVASYFLFYRFL